jgi:hypothetical protein
MNGFTGRLFRPGIPQPPATIGPDDRARAGLGSIRQFVPIRWIDCGFSLQSAAAGGSPAT